MVVLLLDDGLDHFLRGYSRTNGAHPAHVSTPDRFVKVQGQHLKDARGDTAEVDESLNGIGNVSDQVLAAFIDDTGQITLRGFSDTGPGMSSKPVEKGAHQVFEHLEADLDLEPVAVGKDHIPGRKAQIRADQNESIGAVCNQDKADFIRHRFPEQVQTQKADLLHLPIKLDWDLLKELALAVEQFDELKFLTIDSWPASTAGFRRSVGEGHHVAFRPCHDMHQRPASIIMHLFKDCKHRTYGKIGVEHQ
jgi:hypothetical protein